ncbi:MAG: LamG domain-containing protein [Planctomycetota bacterium]
MCRKLVYSILLLVLGLMVSVAGADVTSDLVAWWALDDGSGMTAKDSAGHPGGPHDGALQNGPLWESADFKVGRGALKFDGIDDRIVVESFDLQGTGITLAAWIKPPDLATFNDPRLISKAQGGGTPDHYWAMVLSGSGEDNLEFRLRTDTGAPTRRTSPQGNDMRADEWAHLAVTWDAGDPFMRLYKNGREIDSVSKAGTAVGVGPGVRIGVGNQSVSAGSGSMDRPFPGILDDVRIYERGLSAEDITELVAWQGAPVPLTLACCPSPADEATDVPRDVVLSWTPGIFAPPISGHKVFLSENFNDVNDGIGGVTQDANSYEPAQRLDLGKTYYWRIDEVNGPPDYTVYQGDVWSFTTEPVGYPIENIIATASSMQSAAMGPENTVNGLGLNDNNLHSKDESDMYMSSTRFTNCTR